MLLIPQFIKNLARRHRPTALKLLSLASAIRGLPSAVRVRAARRRNARSNVVKRDRRIVFISERPGQREAKLAFGLRHAGWDVIQLHREPPNFADLGNFAEFHKFSSPWQALELAHRTQAHLFHVFSVNADDTCVQFVDNKPGRVIIDFYDHFYPVADGLPQLEARYAIDIARQRHCITLADALCCRDLQMAYNRRLTQAARGKPLIYFPEYCWNLTPLLERPAARDIHIVQIGWMGFETRGIQDTGCFRVLEPFVEAGCHVHIYSHPTFPSSDSNNFRNLFADYLRLGTSTGRVHIHPTVSADNLIGELTHYDFGFNITNAMAFDIPWVTHNRRRLAFCGSSRMFDYLDAGLGLLLSPELKLMAHQFRSTGMVVDAIALLKSGAILNALPRPPADRVAAARDQLSIRRHIHRLLTFYEQVM